MKRLHKGAFWAALLAIITAGLIPFAAGAWGRMYPQYSNQQYNRVVTAPYWCGSYYSSYPCNYSTYQYPQPQSYPVDYSSNYSSYSSMYMTYPSYQPITYYQPSSYYPNMNMTYGYNPGMQYGGYQYGYGNNNYYN